MIEDELEQFREEWKAELRQKTRRRASTASSGTVTAALSNESGQGLVERTPGNLTGHLKSAVEVYRRAVDLEQQGQFDDALRLYRQVSEKYQCAQERI
jgi:hypothetical protein